MTPTDPLLATVTAGAGCAYLIQILQKAKSIPWVTDHTHGINIALRALLSLGATLGISHAWNPSTGGGGVLMVTFPPLTVIMIGLWHWFGQFAVMHGFGQVLSIGTLKEIDNPVQVNQVDKQVAVAPKNV
jgi:hypothetical protein